MDTAFSLDEIEHRSLRPRIGRKVHAVLVCAARSCPPLYNRAFIPGVLETQTEGRYRVWLAREDLNHFDPDKKYIEISKVFDWYAQDYTGHASLQNVLSTYAPVHTWQRLPAPLVECFVLKE